MKKANKEYPIEKYHFEVNGNVVTAKSSYAGKEVAGTAKCDPQDEFSLEKGKELAAARCNVKVAEKRTKRAEAKVYNVARELMDMFRKAKKAAEYLDDSKKAEAKAKKQLKNLLKTM